MTGALYCSPVLGRWLIRLAASLVGIAAGLILSVALLSDFSASTTAIVTATILFWIVHIIVNFFAVKVLIRQPSVAIAGLLALASTIIALIIVNIVVSGISIHGVGDVRAGDADHLDHDRRRRRDRRPHDPRSPHRATQLAAVLRER